MKYTKKHLLEFVQKTELSPPQPPQSVFDALVDILASGHLLKKIGDSRSLTVVDKNGEEQNWTLLRENMSHIFAATFVSIYREDIDKMEFWCPDDAEELSKARLPSNRVWTKAELAKRTKKKMTRIELGNSWVSVAEEIGSEAIFLLIGRFSLIAYHKQILGSVGGLRRIQLEADEQKK